MLQRGGISRGATAPARVPVGALEDASMVRTAFGKLAENAMFGRVEGAGPRTSRSFRCRGQPLRASSKVCTHSMIAAIKELQNTGVEPDVWKIAHPAVERSRSRPQRAAPAASTPAPHCCSGSPVASGNFKSFAAERWAILHNTRVSSGCHGYRHTPPHREYSCRVGTGYLIAHQKRTGAPASRARRSGRGGRKHRA